MEELDKLIQDFQTSLGLTLSEEQVGKIKETYSGNTQGFFKDMLVEVERRKGKYIDVADRVKLKRYYNIPFDFSEKLALSEARGNDLAVDTGNTSSSAIGPYQITRGDHEKSIKDKLGVDWDAFSSSPRLQDEYMSILEAEYDKVANKYKDYRIVKEKGLTNDQIKAAIHVLGPSGASTYLQTGDYPGDRAKAQNRINQVEQAFNFFGDGIQAYDATTRQEGQPTPTTTQPTGNYSTQINWGEGTAQVSTPKVERSKSNTAGFTTAQTIDWSTGTSKVATTQDGEAYNISKTTPTTTQLHSTLKDNINKELATSRAPKTTQTTIPAQPTPPTESGYSWGSAEPTKGLYNISKTQYATTDTFVPTNEAAEIAKDNLASSKQEFVTNVVSNLNQTEDSFIDSQIYADKQGTIEAMGGDYRAEQEYRINGANEALSQIQDAAEILMSKLSTTHPNFEEFLKETSSISTQQEYQSLLDKYPNIKNDKDYHQYESLRQGYSKFKNFKDNVTQLLTESDPDIADLYKQKEFSRSIRDQRLYNLPLTDRNESNFVTESVDIAMRNLGRFVGRLEEAGGGALNLVGLDNVGGKLMRRGQDLRDLNPKDLSYEGMFQENYAQVGDYKVVYKNDKRDEVAYVRDSKGNQVQFEGEPIVEVGGKQVNLLEEAKTKDLKTNYNGKVFTSMAADTVLDLAPQIGGTAALGKLLTSMGVKRGIAYSLGAGFSGGVQVRGNTLNELMKVPGLTQDQRETIATTLATFTGVVSNINPLEKNLALGIFSRTTSDYIKKNAAKIASGQLTARDIAKYGITQVASGIGAGVKETAEEVSELVFEKSVVNPIANDILKTELEEGISEDEWITTIGLSTAVGLIADAAGNFKLNFKDPLHKQAFIFATQDPEIFQAYVDGVKRDNPEFGAKIEEVFTPVIQELSTLDKKPTEAQVVKITEYLHEAKKLQDKINTTQNPVRKKELELELESIYNKLTEKEKEVEQNKEEEVIEPTSEDTPTEQTETTQTTTTTPADTTAIKKEPSFTSTQKVGDYVDTPVVFEGKRGILQTRVETDKKGNKQTFYTLKVGNKTFDLGDVNADTDLESAGLDLADAVNVTPEGVIEIRGQQYQNLFDTPTTAIDRDGNGNYVVRLDTVGDKPEARTFRGQIAEDLAYQITLQKITRDNEAEFNEFLDQKDSEGQIPEPDTKTTTPTDGVVSPAKGQKQAPGAPKKSSVRVESTQPEKVSQKGLKEATEGVLLEGFEPVNTQGEKITGKVFIKEENGSWRARSRDKNGNLTKGTNVSTASIVEQLEKEAASKKDASSKIAPEKMIFEQKVGNRVIERPVEVKNGKWYSTNQEATLEGEIEKELDKKYPGVREGKVTVEKTTPTPKAGAKKQEPKKETPKEKQTPVVTSLEKLGTTEKEIKAQIKKAFSDRIPGITPEQSQKLTDVSFIMWKAVANTLGGGKALQYMKKKVAQIGVISTAAKAQETASRIGAGLKFQIIGEKGAAALDAAEESSIRLDNLQVAREMETSGKDPKTIRLATGWERGKDDKWRYEILDGGLKGKAKKDTDDGYSSDFESKLENVLNNEELFKAYPELKDIKVIFNTGGNTGSYDSQTKTIEVSSDSKSKKLILLHEVQHAIQDIEGFARGGSPVTVDTDLSIRIAMLKDSLERAEKAFKPVEQNREEFSNEYYNTQKDKIDLLKNKIKTFEKVRNEGNLTLAEKYLRLSGEVESRNVVERVVMNPEQRREILLEQTEDISRKDQVVLFNTINDLIESVDRGEIKLQQEGSQDITAVAEQIVNNAIDHLTELNKKGLEKLRGTNDKETKKQIQETINSNKRVILQLTKMRKDPKFSLDTKKEDSDNILKVFHGTSKDKDFKKFKDSGKGIFVTVDPKEASEYSEQNDGMKFGDYDPSTGKFKEINTASRVIPLNVNLGNSYKLTDEDFKYLNSKPNYGALQKSLHQKLKNEGYDSVDYGKGVYAILTEGRLNNLLTNEVMFSSDNEVFRGVAIQLANGQNIIAALEKPLPSTLMHELSHAMIEEAITPEERQAIIDEYNEVFGDNTTEWNTDTSEYFARLYERFLSNGRKLTEVEVKNDTRRNLLQQAFDTFTELVKELQNALIEYTNTKGIKKTISLSPAAQSIFDRVTGINQQQNIQEDEKQINQEVLNQETGGPSQKNLEKGVLNTPVEKAIADLINDPGSAPFVKEEVAADLLSYLADIKVEIAPVKVDCKK